MIQIKVMNNKKDKKKEEQEKLVENFGDGKVGEVRSYVWDLMEKPWTSDAAQWYAVFSMIVVVISTVTFVLSTMPELTDDLGNNNITNNQIPIFCGFTGLEFRGLLKIRSRIFAQQI